MSRILRKAVTISTALVLAVSIMTPSTATAHTQNDSNEQKQHLEARAREQLGAPYSYGGTSPRGFDCSGFTRWVFSGHGPELPHSSDAQFELASRDGYKRIWERNELEVGDLVFHDTGSGRVGHAGMYIGGGKFISATSSDGVRIRSLHDGYWGPRWVGGTRTPVTK